MSIGSSLRIFGIRFSTIPFFLFPLAPPPEAAEIYETSLCMVFQLKGETACDRKIQWEGSVVIRGKIEKGDDIKFREVIRKMQVPLERVFLRSEGGDVNTAMEIGYLIRKLKASTVGPFLNEKNVSSCEEVTETKLFRTAKSANCVCASACFLIYAAGYKRQMSAVEIHRPYIDRGANAQLTEAETLTINRQIEEKVTRYLEEMSIPKPYISLMLNSPSSTSRRISFSEMLQDIVGYPRPIEEWLYSKCKIPPYSQTYRDMQKDVNSWNQRYSKASWCEFQEIRKLQAEAFSQLQ
jgi:hypothetical protein